MGKPGGKRQLGISRLRWKDDIKMDLHEVGYGDIEVRKRRLSVILGTKYLFP
jgi:hypothetical protein